MITKFTSFSLLTVNMLIFSLIFPIRGMAVTAPEQIPSVARTSSCVSTLFAPLLLSELPGMKRREVEKQLDRHLVLRERQILKILQRHVKRMGKIGLELDEAACKEMERKAENAIVFGIIGLFLVGFILGFMAIAAGLKAKKLANANPDCPEAARMRKKGNAGIILGIADIIAGIVLIVLVL